jgi:hypothetical protein
MFRRLRLSPAVLAFCAFLPVLALNAHAQTVNPVIYWNRTAVAAEVLVAMLKTDWLPLDVTSEVMSGTIRHFDSISDAEAEATRSRVYAGAHFTFDLVTGERLGRRIADFVLDHPHRLDK